MKLFDKLKGFQKHLLHILIIVAATYTLFIIHLIAKHNAASSGPKTLIELQAEHLSKSALSKAIVLLQNELTNNLNNDNQSLAYLLKQPAQLSPDMSLSFSSFPKKSFVFNQEDLKDIDTDVIIDSFADLDEASYSIKVTIEPGIFYPFPSSIKRPYSIPGIDIRPPLRADITSYLQNNDTHIDKKLFDTIYLYDFSDWLTNLLPNDIFLPTGTIGLKRFKGFLSAICKSFDVDSILSLDTSSSFDFNLSQINLNKIPRHDSITSIWGTNYSLKPTPIDNYYVEKIGELIFISEATINYANQSATKITRASKQVKVIDFQPPAPLYSFFLSNSKNAKPDFNSATLTIENMPKDISETALIDIPGLVRVNWAPFSDNNSSMSSKKNKQADYIRIRVPFEDLFLLFDIIGNDISLYDEGQILGFSQNDLISFITKNSGSVAELFSPFAWRKDNYYSSLIPSHLYGTDLYAEWSEETKQNCFNNLQVETTDGFISWLVLVQNHLHDIADGITNIAASTDILSNKITDISKLQIPTLDFVEGAIQLSNFSCWDSIAVESKYDTGKTSFFGKKALSPTFTKEIEGAVQKEYQRNFLAVAQDPEPNEEGETKMLAYAFLKPIYDKYAYNFFANKPLNQVENKFETEIPYYEPSKEINFVPNLYSLDEYREKASYYYNTFHDFVQNMPNRVASFSGFVTKKDGIDEQQAFLLNGITYIAGDLGSYQKPFCPAYSDTFYVTGSGMIVVEGNIFLDCDIKTMDTPDKPSIFSLIARAGGIYLSGTERILEGSIYTHLGIKSSAILYSLTINGNWITDEYNEQQLPPQTTINFYSSKVRALSSLTETESIKNSMAILHPEWGKYIPDRYLLNLAPDWISISTE